MTRGVPFAGCVVLLGLVASFAPAAQPGGGEERLNIEAVTTLDAQGGYIRLEGQSLFLTSDLQEDPRAGYWLDVSSDPRSPAQVCGSLPCGWDVALAGDHALVCDYTKLLSVYEIRDRRWQQVAKLDMPSMTENLLVRGKLAYVANHVAGLTIVDISRPSRPSIVSNFNPQIDCDALGLRQDCAILYAHWESRLVLVDIKDPAQPRQIGVFQNDPKTFNQGELAIDGDFAYCTTLTGMVIVNIADPAKAKLAKSVDIQGPVTDVMVRDGYAFVAAGRGGVRVFDVRDPNRPEEIGYYKSGDKLAACQLAVQPAAGGKSYYLYVANRGGPATVLLFNAPGRE